jgi:uncharacterized protein YlxW (UPF0749 family)
LGLVSNWESISGAKKAHKTVVTKPSNDARTKTFTDLRRKKLRRGETRKKRARVMDRRRELASYRSKRNQGESLMEKDLETLKMVLGAFFPLEG